LRLRNRPWAAPELSECGYYAGDPEEFRGRWSERFGNKNPIWLEIGCGKGLYIAGKAPLNPQINYIGADIKSLMLAYARRNIEEAFAKTGQPVSNVVLLSVDAERIYNAFSEDDKIDRIILNFSNPWPKPHHHKRRLTHPKQLEHYKAFLKDGGIIEFKTDNDELFEASKGYFEECRMQMNEVCDDYYATHDMDPSVLTEHEQKFLAMQMPIHYIKASYRA